MGSSSIGATGRSFIPAGLGQRLADAVDVAGANGAVEEAVVMMWTASPERHQVPRRDRWQVADREAVHENLYQDWDRPG